MNRGMVNLKELRKNIRNADFEGKSAFCFKMNDKILKIYAREEDGIRFIPPDITKIHDFSSFSADTIVFPDAYIYENGRVAGEISKYINSKSLDTSINGTVNIKKMLENYDFVLSDLYTYDNIDMIDLCYVNVLYSNENGFNIIDTTEWQFKDNSYKMNVHNLNGSLIDAFVEYLKMPITYSKYYSTIDKNFFQNMAKYGPAGKRLQSNMNLLMNNKYCFLELLFAYMEAYRVYSGKEAETLKDINEFTKVLKKG